MMKYDSDDSDFAAAMAASAYAIHSIGGGNSKAQFTKTSARKQHPFGPSQPGSERKPSTKDTRGSSFMRPGSVSYAEGQRQKEVSRGSFRGSDARSDSWEKAQIMKIRKRYNNIHSQIQDWENEKKMEEKRKMERKKGEIELRKSRNLRHYYSKIAKIDNIASGARAQAEDKRKHEESSVKEKARRMRMTGNFPVKYCFCF